MLISRISRRISTGTVGRPPRRLDFQRQYDLNPARCQRTMVSGFERRELRWHRAGFLRYWRWKWHRRGGRPQIVTELRALIRQMSTENLLWGAPRIHGELLKLGFSVAHAIRLFDLAFCVTLLTFGSLVMHLDIDTLRTMTLVTLAFNGQAVFYVVRERRRLWSSRPSLMVIVSSILDVLIIGTLALRGILMAPLEPSIVASIFAAAIVLACIMDQVKIWLFAHFKMA